MALDQREEKLLDAILEYAKDEKEWYGIVNKVLPGTIIPPNPDCEALKYYNTNMQSYPQAMRDMVNSLCAKIGSLAQDSSL